MADLPEHYRRWDQAEIVERFAAKAADEFFASETRFLAPVAAELESVVDVGCASGRFLELLGRLGAHPSYTGIDLSPQSVARAQQLYPGHAFHCANALDFEPASPADLVNATGVVQHEPRFDELIRRMVSWSRRFVLFDAKLSAGADHLADRARGYVATDPPLYFVVLSLPRLLETLAGIGGLSRIAVYAYDAPLNARVRLPDGFGPVASAGILIEKGGAARPSLDLDLPDWLAASLPGPVDAR